MDGDGNLVADGDLAGQARQVYANLKSALSGAGAQPADVAKLTPTLSATGRSFSR